MKASLLLCLLAGLAIARSPQEDINSKQQLIQEKQTKSPLQWIHPKFLAGKEISLYDVEGLLIWKGNKQGFSATYSQLPEGSYWVQAGSFSWPINKS